MTRYFFSLLLLLLSPNIAMACGMAMSIYQNPDHPLIEPTKRPALVDILGEEAIIVWNPVDHIEHFIRRASFNTQVPDFGFLVPTPSIPQLAAVDSSIFKSVENRVAPFSIPLPDPEFYTLLPWRSVFAQVQGMISGAAGQMGSGGDFSTLSQAPYVRVVETKQIAGYEASILQANDPKALADWLRAHGYESRPALEDWLKPYIESNWSITAFKIAAANKESHIRTSPVRLTFQSPGPFFPYREPADQRAASNKSDGRILRVYLIAPGKGDATIGQGGQPFPGKIPYSTITFSAQQLLKGVVPESDLSSMEWITVFDDPSNPRLGVDDLLFSTRRMGLPTIRMPQIDWHVVDVPVEPLVFAISVVGLALLFLLRREIFRSGQ